MAGPNWKLEDDLKTVTITFPTDPPVTMSLGLSEVETLLANLGDFRALMSPPVPADWPMGQEVGAIPDPRWSVEPEMMLGNSLLHIRDPRYGWLHYVLPREMAGRLGGFLTAQAESPPPGPAQAKPN